MATAPTTDLSGAGVIWNRYDLHLQIDTDLLRLDLLLFSDIRERYSTVCRSHLKSSGYASRSVHWYVLTLSFVWEAVHVWFRSDGIDTQGTDRYAGQ